MTKECKQNPIAQQHRFPSDRSLEPRLGVAANVAEVAAVALVLRGPGVLPIVYASVRSRRGLVTTSTSQQVALQSFEEGPQKRLELPSSTHCAAISLKILGDGWDGIFRGKLQQHL